MRTKWGAKEKVNMERRTNAAYEQCNLNFLHLLKFGLVLKKMFEFECNKKSAEINGIENWIIFLTVRRRWTRNGQENIHKFPWFICTFIYEWFIFSGKLHFFVVANHNIQYFFLHVQTIAKVDANVLYLRMHFNHNPIPLTIWKSICSLFKLGLKSRKDEFWKKKPRMQ